MFKDAITSEFENLTSLKWLDLSCSIKIVDVSTISINLTSSAYVNFGSMSSFIYNGILSSSNLDWLRGLRNLITLRLSGVDLSKAFQSTKWAEQISLLSNLRLLHLSNCKIFSHIPIKQLLNCTKLYSLKIDSNPLTPSLPSQLANLTSLSILDFTNSNLQGSIPYLPQLQRLYVGNNPNITIDLNSMFAVPWPRLEILHVQYTHIGGSIPTSLTNTTSLVNFVADGCSIQGSIPSSIMNLSRLEILQLNSNNITGHLPPSISNLKYLQYLSLVQNSLEGYIPDSICEISSLQYLNFAANRLTGNLPKCIARLPNLSTLYIFVNKLSGSLPISLFQNSTLTALGLGLSGLSVKVVEQHSFLQNFQPLILDFSSCNIRGGIPDFISNLTQLIYLDLGNNSLSGTIPPWLFNLPTLSYLDLSLNNLQGILPPTIRLHSSLWPTTVNLAENALQGLIPHRLENVDVINLSANNFTGYIPTQLGQISNIKYISLSGNKIFGQIPLSFCLANKALMLLDLSDNSLSGTVPPTLGNCKSLVYLNLGRNNLGGNIPNELAGAKNLSYLDLSGNNFSGSFPTFIRRLQNMEVLNLANNTFEGTIPPFTGNLKNLRIFLLASNFFNGSIPQEITNLERLQFIRFSNNRLSGPLPEGLDGLKMLTSRPKDGTMLAYILSLMLVGVKLDLVSKGMSRQLDVVYTYHSVMDLSWNCLTGTIPQKIGLLHGLHTLNLSHNCLYGEIPRAIGDMSGLESLDISFNRLSGEIPETLASLDFLTVFNLSYNNLSGKIPNVPHFDTLSDNGSAYTGNKFLCGAPGGMNCDGNRSSIPKTIHDEDVKHNYLFYGIVIMGYGFGFWGFFGTLYFMKDNWRQRYWRAIDKIVLRIIHCI